MILFLLLLISLIRKKIQAILLAVKSKEWYLFRYLLLFKLMRLLWIKEMINILDIRLKWYNFDLLEWYFGYFFDRRSYELFFVTT